MAEALPMWQWARLVTLRPLKCDRRSLGAAAGRLSHAFEEECIRGVGVMMENAQECSAPRCRRRSARTGPVLEGPPEGARYSVAFTALPPTPERRPRGYGEVSSEVRLEGSRHRQRLPHAHRQVPGRPREPAGARDRRPGDPRGA